MDKYENILNKIKNNKYKRIIVSGPQRTGTRFTANAISYDLNFEIIDELDFDISDLDKFKKILSIKENIVVQAPAISNYLHTLSFNNCTIIFMYRNINDIITSQENCWTEIHDNNLRKQIKDYFNNDSKIIWSKPISEIKYQVWELIQLPQLKIDSYNLEYESLKNHLMWINKDKRIIFKANQIK